MPRFLEKKVCLCCNLILCDCHTRKCVQIVKKVACVTVPMCPKNRSRSKLDTLGIWMLLGSMEFRRDRKSLTLSGLRICSSEDMRRLDFVKCDSCKRPRVFRYTWYRLNQSNDAITICPPYWKTGGNFKVDIVVIK